MAQATKETISAATVYNGSLLLSMSWYLKYIQEELVAILVYYETKQFQTVYNINKTVEK